MNMVEVMNPEWVKEAQENAKQQKFDGRRGQRNLGVITMKTSRMSNWSLGMSGGKQTRGKIPYVNQLHHPHLLPVLLMFRKLPKLFNFHILRLAAEREISTGERGKKRKTSTSVKKRLLRNIQRNTFTNLYPHRRDSRRRQRHKKRLRRNM